MPKKTIFRGSVANDGTGDNLRFGAEKVNDNFTELYTLLGDGSTLSAGTIVTTSEAQTLTNKVINGANNTISNIPASALAFNSITIGDDTSTNFSVALGESFEIIGGSGISTAITNNRIVLSTDGSIVTETSTDTLTNKTLAAGSNTITGLTNTNLSGTAGITNANLANSSIRIGDDSSTNFNVGLGESFEIIGGTGVTTAITNNRIELSVGSIPNSSLSNSSLTLGATAVSLGATAASASNFSLTGASSVSGTGTIDLTGAGSKARFDFAGFGSLPAHGTYQGMFAFDTVGNRPYYSSGSGWVRILDENSSVSAHTDVNITGVADGHILQWSSGDGRFNVVANPASGITVEEEGSALATAGTTVDFVGEGVTASGTGAEKTINIPGGATAMIDVTSNSSSAYRFSSHYGTEDNPTIFTKQGQTIAFNLNGLAGSHPFVIQTSSGSTYTAGNRITTGLTHIATDGTVTTGVSAQNKTSGILYFEVPYNQATVYYICASHGGMNGTLSVAKKEGGALLQQVNTQSGAVATGTTIFPEDDTIPQNTEGDEFMTLSITPKSATSTLNIEAHVFYSCTNSTRGGAGLFKDSDANALAFTSNFIKDTTSMGNMQVFFSETSGSTSARTYKIRCGNIQTSGTFTFNGQGGARKFGGTVLSTIRILEIEA